MNTRIAKSVLLSPWLIGYGLVAAAQLALIVFHLPAQIAFVSTWLVAPILAIWVWRAHGPKLLVLAFLLCWVGDVLGNPRLLGLGPGALLVSVAAFGLACVVLIALFVRRGALRFRAPVGRRRWRFSIAAIYLAVIAVVLGIAWGSLDPTLRIAGALYLAVLAMMATMAFVLDTWTGVGAALVVAAHNLVVLEVAGLINGTATVFRLAFWILYMLGILIIAIRVVGWPRATSRADRNLAG